MNWLNNLSITRKIMLALIVVGLLPAVTVAVISNMQAESILAEEASITLQAMRDNRKNLVERYMADLSAQVSILAQEPYVTKAIKGFSAEFNQLDKSDLPETSVALRRYYTEQFSAYFKKSRSRS